MTATNLRSQADYFYWALTLRLVDTVEVEAWATDALADAEVVHSSFIELSTCHALDTESILTQLRLVPGESNPAATFRMLMRLLSERFFTGVDDLSYTMRLCEALHHQFSTPGEPYTDLLSLRRRWEGVEYGFGEPEKLFRKAFEDLLRKFRDEENG